jgi:hypothetical protein
MIPASEASKRASGINKLYISPSDISNRRIPPFFPIGVIIPLLANNPPLTN